MALCKVGTSRAADCSIRDYFGRLHEERLQAFSRQAVAMATFDIGCENKLPISWSRIPGSWRRKVGCTMALLTPCVIAGADAEGDPEPVVQ